MKAIYEKRYPRINDRDSIKDFNIIVNNYPTEKGYAVEFWMSQGMVHIIVYDVNLVEGE